MTKVTTADRLRQIMHEHNLKQVDIIRLTEPLCQAYKIKIGRNDLSQYISGKIEPRQNKLYILAKALNVNEAWLMGFDVPIERGERDEENNPHHTKILMPNVTLGELIKQYRMNNNLTMDEFSKMSGLSKGYISMLERDEHPKTKQSIIPSFETLVSISNAMNYDIDFLISILYSKQSTKLNDIHSASNIAERIQEIAHKKNMSLHTALDECNINRSLLSEMKSRNFYPRIDVILKLSEYFNCSVDYLTCRTDNPNERYNPSGKKSGTLAADEEQLLDNYNKLNPTGKDKVQDYTEDLTGNEKFTNTNLKPSPFSKSELPAEPEYQIAAWGGKETKGDDQPPLEEAIL